MKRLGNIYHKIYDIDNIKLAHKKARKGKTYYKEVEMVDSDPKFYFKEVSDMLKNKTYKTSKYEIFTKYEPKKREIYKLPYYPDRIVQWAVMMQIQSRFDKHFIYDTYSAINGKGTHRALKRLDKFMKDKKNTRYCLKLDIKKYYPSIDRKILKKKLKRIFKDKDLLWLLEEIIDSNPGPGIPIGNYLSQYFGNYFLSDLDHFCKEELKTKYYIRYMDDICILSNSKRELRGWFREIEKKVNEDKLRIKGNWQIFPSRVRGVDFLGYRHFGNRIILRKSIYKKIKRRCNFLLKQERITFPQSCSYNSYMGWLKWTTCDNFKKKYIGGLNDK